MRFPSLGEMRAAGLKPEGDTIWVSRVYRGLSLQVSRLAIGLGLSAFAVTTISGVFALAASGLLLLLTPASLVASIIFLQVFVLLDHVDGEVARYAASVGAPSTGLAGPYYDQLMHFLQGPSFYFCLGLGLSWQTGARWWGVIGGVTSLATSAFPWLVAQYAIVGWLKSENDSGRVQAAAEAVNRHVFQGANVRSTTYIIPRSLPEALWLARQLLGAPNSLFLFSGLGILDLILFKGTQYPLMMGFLVAMAAMKSAMMLLATRFYLGVLKDVA